MVFINYTKPPGSVWSDVIDYWVEWDCDAWVLDLKDREPALWLPPGTPAESSKAKSAKAAKAAKPKRQNNKSKRQRGEDRGGDNTQLENIKPGGETPPQPAKPPAPTQPKPPRKIKAGHQHNPNAKRPMSTRDDKLNGAYLTRNIMLNLRRITGIPAPPYLSSASSLTRQKVAARPKPKKLRKPAPNNPESGQSTDKEPAKAGKGTPESRAYGELENGSAGQPISTPDPGISDHSIAGSVKNQPRKRKPKVFDDCELHKPTIRKPAASISATQVTPTTIVPTFPDGARFPRPVSLDLLLNPTRAGSQFSSSSIPSIKEIPVLQEALVVSKNWEVLPQQASHTSQPFSWKDIAFGMADPLPSQQYSPIGCEWPRGFSRQN